jgi:hypothetical protein
MNGNIYVDDPRCNFCNPALTPNTALHNQGCYSDADCGGLIGSCHKVKGRCSPESAFPYQECDPGNPLGDAQCHGGGNLSGRCADNCFTLFQYAAGGGIPEIAIPTAACQTPP